MGARHGKVFKLRSVWILMTDGRVSTGSDLFDDFLQGGYENGVITTLYGPSGSGKTNLCLFALIRMTGSGKKVLYIDSESSFSVERLKQVTKYSDKVLDRVIFLRPVTFQEQRRVFEKLSDLVNDDVGLIVVDTIAMLYRLELGKEKGVSKINSALVKQIAILIKIARKHDLPILVANQVYADFNEKDKVNLVGGDILRNGSRCLIELQRLDSGRRRAFLRKHRSLREKYMDFVITEKGIAL
jgi:DNA repair protein RadB